MLQHAGRIVRKFVGSAEITAKSSESRDEMLLTYFFKWYHRAVTSPEYLAAKLASCPDMFRSPISTSIP